MPSPVNVAPPGAVRIAIAAIGMSCTCGASAWTYRRAARRSGVGTPPRRRRRSAEPRASRSSEPAPTSTRPGTSSDPGFVRRTTSPTAARAAIAASAGRRPEASDGCVGLRLLRKPPLGDELPALRADARARLGLGRRARSRCRRAHSFGHVLVVERSTSGSTSSARRGARAPRRRGARAARRGRRRCARRPPGWPRPGHGAPRCRPGRAAAPPGRASYGSDENAGDRVLLVGAARPGPAA